MICCLIPSAFAVGARTYYLDSENGNDANSGMSESDAWKTLEKANSVAFNPGDKILLKAGSVFTGPFNAKGNGEEGNEIIVSSYGDIDSLGKPLIRSDKDISLFNVNNVSYWKVSNLSFTAPEGKGLYVTADGDNIVKGITISDCCFSNIYYKECAYCDHFPIYLISRGEKARLDGITVKDCHIEKCAFGISMGGLTYEWTRDLFVSPEVSYNRNFLLEGLTLNDIYNDGIIICSIYGLTVRNCSLIDTSTSENHYTAPMWSHHADNYLIENCEIAGSINTKDGMAVDFDGWTTNATYQYIYSHDNARFIRNCCYDNYTKNDNCCVRYCLSVNDNLGGNEMAQMLTTGSVDYADDEWPVEMTNFRFYNNTIINPDYFKLSGLASDAIIANNIFVGDMTCSFIQMRKSVDDKSGEYVYRDYNGTLTNNCFFGVSIPMRSKNNYICNPDFVSDDVENKDSFKLSSSSKLIGKGIQVEDDMGEYDFYGNKLTSVHNIGCYDGEGEDGSQSGFAYYFGTIKGIINSVLGAIYNFIDNCNNRYWIF